MRGNGVVRLREILWFRSKSKTDAKLIAAIHRTGLFDAAYYLANNPDVAANGIDPALHFAQRGWKEGRKPGPRFDPVHYLEQNPDVAKPRPRGRKKRASSGGRNGALSNSSPQ
jgi:hypothetical protein